MGEPIFGDPRFDALRNALYHAQRRSFFDSLNRISSFTTIVFGTAVVSKIGDKAAIGVYIESGTVISATLQFVFDFAGIARTHELLQRRYYEILSEIEEKGAVSEEERQKYSAKLLQICSEEPLTMRALDAVAYNQAVDATIADPSERKKYRIAITRWQHLCRHVLVFQNADFKPEIP